MAEILTKDTFIEKIFDFENENEWKYKGKRPVVLDFFTDSSKPCEMISPIIDELSVEYKDYVDFYKINTEEQNELRVLFGVISVPSLIFVQADKQPQLAPGALPKGIFKEIIKDIFRINK